VREEEDAQAFSAEGASVDSSPLTPLVGGWIGIRAFAAAIAGRRAPCSRRMIPVPPGHVNATGFPEIEVPSVE
jgi:hypothetical protein